MGILDDIRFASIVIEESKRVVVCHPSLLGPLRKRLAEMGIEGLVELWPNPNVPADTAYVIDQNVLDAAMAESLQRMRFR